MDAPPPVPADGRQPATAPLLRMTDIRKRFQGVRALDGVSLLVHRGEIQALLGGNGAGKSTLLNVLSGLVVADSGRIELAGREVSIGHPRQAQALGISTIHQELSTVPDLTVLENIFLGREAALTGRSSPFVNRHQIARRIADLAAEFGITRSELWRPVGEFGALKKRAIEIVKALAVPPQILILDEPTSGLEEHEKTLLFEHMRSLQRRGVALIWVTHHLDEVFGLADVVTVMRDGRTIARTGTTQLTKRELAVQMFGGDATELMESAATVPTPRRRDGGESQPRLRASNLSRHGVLRDISFDLRRGEVLGVAGLAGSGRTELVRALMGLDKLSSGRIEIDGRPSRIGHPKVAYRAGLAMVPEDRKQLGILPDLSVAENISVSALGTVTAAGLLRRGRERALTDSYVRRLGIKTPGPAEPIRNLSGGNQQKAIIARCLNTKPSILIFDEPTQGIDIHAKAEVHRLIRDVVAEGTSVIVIASEFAELISLCDRVIVLNRGALVGEISDIPHRVATEGYDAVKHAIIDKASRADR
ncbi:sugar ABC transporter ATP-binding protein [Micromonospora sp. WMMD882]|uniref:sugar ABC transporter ATP-binding protein n=1 Tax=Micromonospora sp. WMMD882 TaxID=3015151 RepID=UPI00248C80B3|nr:sugar ABC transporter ATP-binding protein [Micromonospora sp. WMMD882]WBB78473.1 sugar ABC transporter ATP-binding protein [Micromonospora sp. WMMD882]